MNLKIRNAFPWLSKRQIQSLPKDVFNTYTPMQLERDEHDRRNLDITRIGDKIDSWNRGIINNAELIDEVWRMWDSAYKTGMNAQNPKDPWVR